MVTLRRAEEKSARDSQACSQSMMGARTRIAAPEGELVDEGRRHPSCLNPRVGAYNREVHLIAKTTAGHWSFAQAQVREVVSGEAP